MSNCVPSTDINGHVDIGSLPPAIKGPIIGLSVVFSVVVVVAVIVIVILVKKLRDLKKGISGVGSKVAVGAVKVGADIKEKMPEVDVNVKRPDISVDVEAGFDKVVDFGAHLKGALDGAVNVAIDLDIGIDASNPFFTIFNALPYAALLVNTKGVIVRANLAARDKWGYPQEELQGKLYKVVVSPKELDARIAQIEQLLKGVKASFEIDSVDIKLDGKVQQEIDVEVAGSIIRILGKTYVFLLTGHVCFTAKGERQKTH